MQSTAGAGGAGAGAGAGGLFGSFFGGGKRPPAAVEMTSRAVSETQRPKVIEGWLMKKSSAGGGQLIGAEWQKR